MPQICLQHHCTTAEPHDRGRRPGSEETSAVRRVIETKLGQEIGDRDAPPLLAAMDGVSHRRWPAAVISVCWGAVCSSVTDQTEQVTDGTMRLERMPQGYFAMQCVAVGTANAGARNHSGLL